MDIFKKFQESKFRCLSLVFFYYMRNAFKVLGIA